jgi:hypothetical protein
MPIVFTKSDPRRKFSEISLDPRIHFLLINYACQNAGYDPKSPMVIYDSKNIATEMQVRKK